MADARVRRALTYAIDGQSLIDNVMQGSATASRGVIPLSLAGAIETGSYTYDPGRTKSELRALGINDLRVKIIWESGEFAADTDIMESVVQMLSAAGVNATLQQFEPGGDIAQWRQGKAGDWDVLGNGYPSPTGLALTIMQGMYAGTAEKEATRDSYHGYVFPEITRSSPGFGGSRPRPPRWAARRRAASDLGHVPDDVVLRPQGGPRPPHPHRRNQPAPHELLRPGRRDAERNSMTVTATADTPTLHADGVLRDHPERAAAKRCCLRRTSRTTPRISRCCRTDPRPACGSRAPRKASPTSASGSPGWSRGRRPGPRRCSCPMTQPARNRIRSCMSAMPARCG